MIYKEKAMRERIYLHDGWLLSGGGYKDISAKVPGCVHTDLSRAGLLPDLYYRDTNKDYIYLENEDFDYTLTFDSARAGECAKLVFEGLDTYCDIYLNGEALGECHNMFISHSFDVTGKLKPLGNELRVHFRSAVKEVEGLPLRNGSFTLERLYSRRVQCTYSWDWVDRFVTAGMWLPVYIEYGADMKITDSYVYTTLIDDFGAEISCTLNFEGYEAGSIVNIEILDKCGKAVYEKGFYVRENSLSFRANIPSPELWYPYGYGEQPLYTLNATVCGNTHKTRFGIRTLRVAEVLDEVGGEYYDFAKSIQEGQEALWGRRSDRTERPSGFILLVNGKRIYARGGNYVPAEPFPSEITEEKIRRIVEMSRDAGVNMIRVWGGGIFEKDALYDACDEMGILVTQDFLMACGSYPEKEEWFINELKLEAEFAVKKLRNHPSLAWWSGDNENATAGYDTAEDHLGRDSALLGLEPVVRALDPARRFFRSSPYGGEEYMAQTAGTTHTTNFVRRLFEKLMKEDGTGYKRLYKSLVSRFIAEEPTYGLPETASLLRFLTEADLEDETEEMLRYHSKNNPAIETSLHDFVKGFANGLLGGFYDTEDRLFKYRYIQYEWIRIVFEATRRMIGYCDGLIFWMLNDCWPSSMGWSIIDYYNMPKAAYYAFRRGARPFISSIDRDEDGFKLYLSSDGGNMNATASVKLIDIESGRVVDTATVEIGVSGYKASSVSLPLGVTDKTVMVADIEGEGFTDRAFYKEDGLPLKRLDCAIVKECGDGYITLTSDRYIHAVALEGDCIFDDNYFSLLPGEERTVRFDKGAVVKATGYIIF